MGGVTSGRLLSGVLLTALLLTGAGSVSYAQGTVITGQDNKASGAYSFVGGGYHNEASGKESSVSGGGFNKASNNYSSVSGGEWNTASGEGSSVSGGGSNTASGDNSSVSGGNRNESSGGYSSVLGGFRNKASGANSSILGGWDNLASGDASSISGGWNNLASGEWSSILGGHENTASGRASSVSGGNLNESRGGYSSILGGRENKTSGNYSSVSGGYWNTATGEQSSVSGGKGNTASGENSSVSGGHHNKAIGDYSSVSGGNSSMALGEESWAAGGAMAYGTRSNAIGNGAVNTYKGNEDTAEKSMAIGYEATADTAGTISFGHDAGDASGYQVKWHKRTDGQRNPDGTYNDYTQAPESITETHYDSARYNRLVKVADGRDDHDAVVMEQLKTLAAASDASNIGTNLTKVPVKDADGNIQYEESGAMKLRDATAEDKTTNAESWGTAIGTGKVEKDDKQLVTGGTVYKALNGGLTKIVIGTPGEPGKDGAPGTIGLVGPAGTNGKDGAVDITIQKGKDDDAKGIKGANGVDGKDGITRIVYTDAAGDHQAATMEDGMKFAGDDGQTSADKVIAKKLNNTIDIIGGADSKKLTDKNIGVNNVGGKLKIQLAQNLTGITSIGNQKTTGEGKDATTTGAKITLDDNDKNISVNGGSIKEVASNLKDGKLIDGSANNAASISDVQTLVQQGVDNGYTNGDGITIQKDSTSGKNVISVNKGDGLKFNDSGELVVNTGDGLEIAGGAVKIKAADNNFKISSNGIGLNDIVTIGTNKNTQVTIDGTKGEISGLSNTTWGKPADYSNSTKAATESQVAQAMSAAIDQAGQNDVDTHVEAGTYAVGTITTDDGKTEQGVSLAIVDKSGKTTNTKVVITDVAKASDVGDVSKLADGVKNADGSTTTVVNAINNVNTKIGDQKYSTSNTSGSNKYVNDGDSITSAIGKLDGAVQNAAEQAGKHSIVSVAEGEKNISVKNIAKEGEAANYQISLNKDLNVTSVTATTVTTDTLNANSATIGGDKGITIKDNTVSGLKDTEIKEGSTNAVNGNTIWKELRPTDDGSYIKKDNTTAQNLVSLDTQVKKTADLINSDGSTIKIGGSDKATKIDISGKDSGGSTTARIITGVQTDAQDATSAANVGYVNDVAAANTQQIYREMHSAYGHLNNNINKAAAGSNALAALHPLDYDPADKASYAVGYGHYRNANAAAVGAFYQPNANTMVSVGVSMGNGDPGVNAGVSFKVGKGSAYNGVSKAQMAETIAAQEKQISEIKASDVAKDQRIDTLEKENQEMKKQIQEILAKLGK